MKNEGGTLEMVIPNDRMLRWTAVKNLVGLSRATVDRQEHLGRFPPRQHLTDFTVGWRKSDVQEWIAGRRDWAQDLASKSA